MPRSVSTLSSLISLSLLVKNMENNGHKIVIVLPTLIIEGAKKVNPKPILKKKFSTQTKSTVPEFLGISATLLCQRTGAAA